MTKRQKDNLITVAIGDHDWGDRLQTVNNQPVDFVEQLVTRLMNENCHLPYEWKLSLALDYRIVSFKSALNVITNRQSNRPFFLLFCLEPSDQQYYQEVTATQHNLFCTHVPKLCLLVDLVPISYVQCSFQLPTSVAACQATSQKSFQAVNFQTPNKKLTIVPACHATSQGRAWGSQCWACPRGCCCTQPMK